MNRLAIFDCDGTLVDSGATIHRALGTAFAAHGLDLPPRAISQKVIGLSLDEAMAELAPDADHGALSTTYKDAGILGKLERTGAIGENMQRHANRAREDRMLCVGCN